MLTPPPVTWDTFEQRARQELLTPASAQRDRPELRYAVDPSCDDPKVWELFLTFGPAVIDRIPAIQQARLLKRTWKLRADFERYEKHKTIEPPVARPRYLAGLTPTIERDEKVLDPIAVETGLRTLYALRITPMLTHNRVAVVDGTSYHLVLREIQTRAEFHWHEDAKEWAELRAKVEALLALPSSV